MHDGHFAELGEGALNIRLTEFPRDQTRICLPCPHPPQPLEPITSDNAVVVVGTIGIADGPTIAHHLVQGLSNRLCNHHIRRYGQRGRCEARHECAEMDIAGEHHMRGTH